jgi:hypothetical protein
MITKAQLINTLDNLPENMTIDQVIEHIIFVEKVHKGLDDSKKGNLFNRDEAKQKLNQWLK